MNCVNALYVYTPHQGIISAKQTKWLADIGIEGDKHAVGGSRQIQLASTAAIESLSHCDGACFSRFKANVVLDTLFISSLHIGTHLRIGESEIEITGFKRCPFSDCPLHIRPQPCLLLLETAVAKVVRSGWVYLKSPVYSVFL